MAERPDSLSSLQTESSSMPLIEVMSHPRQKQPKRVPRDTGFHEPFNSGPNTTLPHPDADLSPNFILSYAGVSDERMMKKHRLSFLKKQRRTVSHGRINPLSEASNSNSNLSLLMSESEKKKMSPLRNSSTISLRISKDGDESLRSGSKRDDDETPPTSPDVSEHPRKSGLFSRFKRS